MENSNQTCVAYSEEAEEEDGIGKDVEVID